MSLYCAGTFCTAFIVGAAYTLAFFSPMDEACIAAVSAAVSTSGSVYLFIITDQKKRELLPADYTLSKRYQLYENVKAAKVAFCVLMMVHNAFYMWTMTFMGYLSSPRMVKIARELAGKELGRLLKIISPKTYRYFARKVGEGGEGTLPRRQARRLLCAARRSMGVSAPSKLDLIITATN
ncbi:unnamed protein product, partial [Mesorhabditis spiculigera]